MRARAAALTCLLTLLSSGLVAAQQNYPTRPIALIVPYPAGSLTDIFARTSIAKANAQFVVENVPGAGGGRGTERVEKAQPDGYTLLFRPQGVIPGQNLVGVSLIATSQLVLVANPQFAARTLQEVIAAMRSKPSQISIGSIGTGTSSYYAVAVFSEVSNVKPSHVLVSSVNEAATKILDGRLSLTFLSLGVSLPLITEGKVRAIAVTGTARSPFLPAVPTFAEAGAGMSVLEWLGVFAPSGTADTIVGAAAQLILAATSDPSVQRTFAQSGYVRGNLVGKDFDRFISQEFRPGGLEAADCCTPRTCQDMKICPKK
jgi:tripartite-type tricarboxylate transporter receptor subunit TctC